MTNRLEIAKEKLGLNKLLVAKEEYAVKIMEREIQIEHLKSEVDKQDEAINKLREELED